MTKGRKPLPTEIKRFKGNPGKRPMENPLEIPDGAPDAPDHLDEVAQAEWDRLVSVLVPAGLVTIADRAAMAAYCVAYSRWVIAERNIKQYGLLGVTPNNMIVKSAWLTIADKAMDQMMKAAAEFGFTPSSRTRVRPINVGGKSAIEKFLDEDDGRSPAKPPSRQSL